MTVENINISETIAKVKETIHKDKSISPEFRTLVELLVVIISLLVNKLGLNSRNSSKPPSTDPNRERGSKRKGEEEQKRKPGGQPGHNGSNLEKVKNPDRVETIAIDKRTLPRGDYKHVGYNVRQVIDIVVSKQVTEYRAEIVEDSNGKRFTASFPEWVTRPVQYGNDLKAQAVYMSAQQLIPYDRIQDYFSDQCGISLSTGSLCNFNKEAYELLETFEGISRKRLITEYLLNNDETGINVNGKLLWLHCASSTRWTLFFPHEKRGTIAIEAMGILKHFEGISCHDHWTPYFQFQCQHALCNAHHLRELERAWEQDGQKWAKKMQELLLEIRDAVEDAGGSLSKKAAKKFRKRYRTILTRGDRECPPPAEKTDHHKRGRTKRTKARNLLERLRNFETETLRFMTDKRVPFTNNQGENDIRMTKVQQKISGCFRSMEGAKIFCRIRSYLLTCRKHGIQATEALRILFSGKLPKFANEDSS
jgi:transposase